MTSDPKTGEQDQAYVQDNQIDDGSEKETSLPGDEADIALDKTGENTARADEAERDR